MRPLLGGVLNGFQVLLQLYEAMATGFKVAGYMYLYFTYQSFRVDWATAWSISLSCSISSLHMRS
jgi:hypothetical protein